MPGFNPWLKEIESTSTQHSKKKKNGVTTMRMAQIQGTLTIPNAVGCRAKCCCCWSQLFLGGNAKGCSHFVKVRQFLTKLNSTLIIWASNPAFWVFTQRSWKQVHTKSCAQMFTAALLKLLPKLKQPNRWMDKPWHSQTIEYHSVLKWIELSSYEKKTWRKLRCIRPSERS